MAEGNAEGGRPAARQGDHGATQGNGDEGTLRVRASMCACASLTRRSRSAFWRERRKRKLQKRRWRRGKRENEEEVEAL